MGLFYTHLTSAKRRFIVSYSIFLLPQSHNISIYTINHYQDNKHEKRYNTETLSLICGSFPLAKPVFKPSNLTFCLNKCYVYGLQTSKFLACMLAKKNSNLILAWRGGEKNSIYHGQIQPDPTCKASPSHLWGKPVVSCGSRAKPFQ